LENSLVISGLSAGYGRVLAPHDVSLTVEAGETVALLGTNGNGKSSLMKCVMGLLRPSAGSIIARIGDDSIDLVGLATEAIVALGGSSSRKGVTFFRSWPSRRISTSAHCVVRRALTSVATFKRAIISFLVSPNGETKPPAVWAAGAADGGSSPRTDGGAEILLIDEPSVGLAPIVVKLMIDAIAELKARLGLTVLMAEQNFHQAIRVADRGYVIVHGSIAFEGKSPAELGENDLVRRLYLGQ
jgi:branched-chain amino acid transport system ATP-binding protein